jgi:phosphate:Na+ symporter
LEVLVVLGGIGLFLVGMIVLSDGLKSLAGASLRRLLSRFTKTPFSGAVFGAFATAILQSSSATTVTAVGFVSAGLMTFAQALGVIFGANIGTTITGWLVAIVGFKLELGLLVIPLVLLGVMLRLFGRGRVQNVGWALVGFGMLFMGIDAMKQGMSEFQGVVTPDTFPGDTLLGRLQLVFIGIAITVATQSSSAGVAAALVAISTGAISFPQAAAMVIGMDVGTTFTAALATLGGSVATRRTGYAHVVYNILTGIMAFALLGPYTAFVASLGGTEQVGQPQIALVAFHTFFNTLGVLLILPFANPFARFIVTLVPERGPPLLRHIDDSLLDAPDSAIDAAAATIRDIASATAANVADLIDYKGERHLDPIRLATMDAALETTRNFIDAIGVRSMSERPIAEASRRRHISAMHALDHLRRLAHRCKQSQRVSQLGADHRLRRLSILLQKELDQLSMDDLDTGLKRMDRLRGLLRRQRSTYRTSMIDKGIVQGIDAHVVLQRLDALRWLHRVAYHFWRILHHLRLLHEQGKPLKREVEEPEQEDEDEIDRFEEERAGPQSPQRKTAS